MKCPVCNTELKRILYEGMTVFRCFGCAGYLVQDKRFEGIRRNAKTPVELLKQEVIDEYHADTIEKIKCPRCFYPMQKMQLPRPASLMIDFCRDCGHVWLDGGELARIQLAYESSDSGRKHIELERRWDALKQKEKKLLENRVNRVLMINPLNHFWL